MSTSSAGSEFVDFWLSDSWQDLRQNDRIRSLQSDVARAHAAAARERQARARLSKLQGSMEVKLERLTKAFEAFVELSDLRERLAMFDASQLARFRSRAALIDLADGRFEGSLAEFDDVPGYWLPPAVKGFVSLIGGELASSGPLIEQAVRRDELRTATFGVLLLAVAQRGDLVEVPWLERAFPELHADVQVTRAQRAVWLAAAEGAYGEPGRFLVRQSLSDLIEGLSDEQRAAEVDRWRARLEGRLSSPALDVPPSLRHCGLDKNLSAGFGLSTLRGWWESATRSAEESGGPATDAQEGDASSPAAIVIALVDEGSEEEAPWLARVAQLRATIEGQEKPAESAPAWDAPVGGPCELMLSDATSDRPGFARQTAARIGTPLVVTVAERLAEQTTVRPETLNVALGHGQKLDVDPSRDLRLQVADTLKKIDRSVVEDAGRKRKASILLWSGVAVVVVGVLLLIANPGLGLLVGLAGVAAIGFGALERYHAHKAKAFAIGSAEQRKTDVTRAVERTVMNYHDFGDRLNQVEEDAQRDLAALREGLSGP